MGYQIPAVKVVVVRRSNPIRTKKLFPSFSGDCVSGTSPLPGRNCRTSAGSSPATQTPRRWPSVRSPPPTIQGFLMNVVCGAADECQGTHSKPVPKGLEWLETQTRSKNVIQDHIFEPKIKLNARVN